MKRNLWTNNDWLTDSPSNSHQNSWRGGNIQSYWGWADGVASFKKTTTTKQPQAVLKQNKAKNATPPNFCCCFPRQSFFNQMPIKRPFLRPLPTAAWPDRPFRIISHRHANSMRQAAKCEYSIRSHLRKTNAVCRTRNLNAVANILGRSRTTIGEDEPKPRRTQKRKYFALCMARLPPTDGNGNRQPGVNNTSSRLLRIKFH